MNATAQPEMLLLFDGNSGIYIPQRFAQEMRRDHVRGVSDEDWMVLDAGPDHEWYWDAWTDVLDNAVVFDDEGTRYRMFQDGDVWAIPDGMEYDEREGTFVWPEDDDPEPMVIQSPPPRPQYVRNSEPVGDRIAWFLMWACIAAAVTILVGQIVAIIIN